MSFTWNRRFKPLAKPTPTRTQTTPLRSSGATWRVLGGPKAYINEGCFLGVGVGLTPRRFDASQIRAFGKEGITRSTGRKRIRQRRRLKEGAKRFLFMVFSCCVVVAF